MIAVTSIQNGLVIDNIRSGQGIKVFHHLGCDRNNLRTALILNVPSNQLGSKDMIKVENVIDLDLDKLGLLAPEATVSIIENGERVRKFKLQPPQTVENVLRCKNPRCATTVETYVPQLFKRLEGSLVEYKCLYCDDIQTIDQIEQL